MSIDRLDGGGEVSCYTVVMEPIVAAARTSKLIKALPPLEAVTVVLSYTTYYIDVVHTTYYIAHITYYIMHSTYYLVYYIVYCIPHRTYILHSTYHIIHTT